MRRPAKASPASTRGNPWTDRISPSFAALSVGLATIAAFLPALKNGFVAWDDDIYLISNEHVRRWTWENMRWMFSALFPSSYHPLTWLSYALDYSVWRLDPFGYHLTNVLLHSLNAAVFFFIASRLLAATMPRLRDRENVLYAGAAFAALIFSLHPLRAEPVAWISERKEVLAGFFYLLSILAYLRSRGQEPSTGNAAGNVGTFWFAISWSCFVLSLLSKSMGISMPATLFLIDVFALKRPSQERESWRKVLWEKAAFAVPVVPICFAAYLGQKWSGALAPAETFGPMMRLARTFYGWAFYLSATLVPVGLSPRYLHPSLDPFAVPYLVAAAVVAGVSALVWFGRKTRPWAIGLWLHYLIALLPVSGLIPMGWMIAADRYTYLPCLPWALLAGGAFAIALEKRRGAALAAGAALLLILGEATRRQLGVWHDTVSLWSQTVAMDPGDFVARTGLATALAFEQGRYADAEQEYLTALKTAPRYAPLRNNYGSFLAHQGRFEEAIDQFRESLRFDPSDSQARSNLQKALMDAANRGKR